jgi:signal transduction histidine kinase
MQAPAKGDWFYDAGENQIYHLYRQPIWLGEEGTGSLLVFRALDNSVLLQNHYPDTDLFLVREGKIVASATSSSIKSIQNPAFRGKVVRDGEMYNQNSLPWIEGSPDAPLLIIQQKITTPFTLANMASMAILMLAAYIFFAWLIVGRWMHRITRRTEHLVQAADNFSTKQHISDEIQNKFAAARTYLNDEIDLLARSLLDLMQTVESSNLAQQRHRDELKQQMLELKRINGELDEFTHFASHDLREPLRKLISFSELLRQDIGTDLPVQAEEDLHYIEDAAIRMRALVDALLTLSDVGNSDLIPQRMELDEAASQAMDALSLPIANSGAVIERDPLPAVLGDPILLSQLYQNLISNALKYVVPGCRPEIRLTFDPDNKTYGIKDNGIGIKPEFATQIFKPFKRLHGRDKYKGSGIGLSICRKIVERHGGEIWVEPAPEGGSHFKFTLGSPLRQDGAREA